MPSLAPEEAVQSVAAGMSAGWMSGLDHMLSVRVYFEDTDAAGIVYHANFLKYMERGRTDMLRLAGIDQSKLMNEAGSSFVGFAVRQCHLDFVAPARLDDELLVTTSVVRAGGAAIDFDQIVGRDGDDLVRARIRVACLNKAGRPRRIPAELRARLAGLAASPDSSVSE